MTLGYLDNAPQRTTKHDTANRKAAFLDALQQGYKAAAAYKITMTPLQTVRHWREIDPVFRAAYDAALRDSPRLTERHIDILRGVAQGRTNPQIATDLGLAAHTVAWHVWKLKRKHNATKRAQLAVEAVRVGAIVVEVTA